MARRILDPFRTARAERMGLVVGLIALAAFAFYMAD